MMSLPKQLDRVPKAHALRSHHPVEHRSARLACAEAVPEILRRADHQRRGTIRVKRTESHQIRTVPLELHPARLCEPLQRNPGLQMLDFFIRDPSHRRLQLKLAVKQKVARSTYPIDLIPFT